MTTVSTCELRRNGRIFMEVIVRTDINTFQLSLESVKMIKVYICNTFKTELHRSELEIPKVAGNP